MPDSLSESFHAQWTKSLLLLQSPDPQISPRRSSRRSIRFNTNTFGETIATRSRSSTTLRRDAQNVTPSLGISFSSIVGRRNAEKFIETILAAEHSRHVCWDSQVPTRERLKNRIVSLQGEISATDSYFQCERHEAKYDDPAVCVELYLAHSK